MAATVSFRTSAVDANDLTTYTFSAKDIGTAAQNRKVLIAIAAQSGSTGISISSVTVAGNNASLVVAHAMSSNTRYRVEIWQIANAALPLGTETSADIVVTASGGLARCGIGTFAIYGARSDAFATGNSEAEPLSASVNCPAGGVIVGVATAIAAGAVTLTNTWLNITEAYDAELEGTPFFADHSGAALAFATTQTSLEVRCTMSASASARAMAVAVFAPISWPIPVRPVRSFRRRF